VPLGEFYMAGERIKRQHSKVSYKPFEPGPWHTLEQFYTWVEYGKFRSDRLGKDVALCAHIFFIQLWRAFTNSFLMVLLY